MTSQNEYHFKLKLKKAIGKFIESLPDEHDLGWLPDAIEDNMTEAAWLIIAANKNMQDFARKENLDLK